MKKNSRLSILLVIYFCTIITLLVCYLADVLILDDNFLDFFTFQLNQYIFHGLHSFVVFAFANGKA